MTQQQIDQIEEFISSDMIDSSVSILQTVSVTAIHFLEKLLFVVFN